ncbi:Dihydrolipoamide acetyltransferase component of pyruvate dehydrogenase complex [Prochlorococcus sp. MIT 0602]|nr:Dihydrolipoamide acetyltransferase component of pyruvate dehydrogenase complex [Prochlorococcus sp. MIT 0602]KGG16965.1 Dihydrolipoamide acetyltransferase component of pyruvate dehydrogenase complex [Prochlorococcus sp. MIT 0603]
MPALSSTMTEGKIVEWLKEPGDKVSRGESVLVVESDKADMDVESFQDGFLAAVLMPAGSTVPVGETIGLIVETKDEIASVQEANPPKIKDVDNKGSSSSQASSEKEVVAKVSPSQSPSPAIAKQQDQKTSSSPSPVVRNQGRVVATPRAKKLSTQLGVDLSTVAGTGPHGRIQADDVKRSQGQPISVPWIAESNAPAQISPPPASLASGGISSNAAKNIEMPEGNSFGSPGETVPFKTLQQAVNRNMETSLEVPCFRVGYSINTDRLDSFYKQVKPNGVTMTALLAKAVGNTLARHPQVNAAYSTKGMVYPAQINVAIAVAMEDGGLITPVLKDANTTDLFELSRQWSDLVKRSRSKQLQPDEYNSGTFTLSNLGMFGVDRFDAILPPGTGAILAVGASLPSVVAGKDGSIAVKRQMQVNLTADHRIVYGADGAAFLKDLANLIENNPEGLSS